MRRSGFTMIEVLVVITIIGILLSITIAVYRDSLENARIKSTRVTIRQLNTAIDQRLESLYRINFRSQAQQFKRLYDSASPPNTPPVVPLKVAEIIVTKDRLRAALPQRLEDLYGLDAVPNTQDDAPLLRVWNAKTGTYGRPTDVTNENESSILLYLALTDGGSLGLPPVPLDGVSLNHIAETVSGLRFFIDEWGNPLRFYNWTTRLNRLGGEGQPIDQANYGRASVLLHGLPPPRTPSPFPADIYSHPINQDPDDQFGRLSSGSACRTPYRLGTVDIPAFSEETFHALDTFSSPLVLSPGPDGRLGLVEPNGWDQITSSIDAASRSEPLGYRNPDLWDQITDNVTRWPN